MPARRFPWRDSSGRTLDDYPRPSLAVDAAVLTVPEGSDSSAGFDPGLHVLLVKARRPSGRAVWALPGTFVHPGETLRDACLRALREKAHVDGLDPQQLHVFDDPARDERGWVVSVGHLDVVPWRRLSSPIENEDVQLVPASAVLAGDRRLPFDHAVIVQFAVQRLRAVYAANPDPYRLLDGPFTLRQLEHLHRAIDPDSTPPKDTFRRAMEPLLTATGELTEGTRGKPARLFSKARRTMPDE